MLAVTLFANVHSHTSNLKINALNITTNSFVTTVHEFPMTIALVFVKILISQC